MHDDWETVEVSEDKFKLVKESYSGDTIAEGKTVRKPFKHNGVFYVATGGFSPGTVSHKRPYEEAYRIVPREQFAGVPKWYGQRIRDDGTDWGEQRRNQPEGFYHGMLIKRGDDEMVLMGPGIHFTPIARTRTEQLSMF